MKKFRRFILVELFIMSFLAGAVSPLGKIALQAFDPFTVVHLRFVLALLVFVPFVRISVEQEQLIRRHWRQILLVAFSGALIPILFFIGLKFTTASIATFLYTLVPILTALHLYFFQKKHLPVKAWIGVGLGVIGVGLIVLLPVISEIKDARLIGNLFGVGAAIAATWFGLLSKRYQKRYNFSTKSITLVFIIVTVFLTLSLAFVETLSVQSIVAANAIELRHWVSLLLLGIFGTTISYLMYQDIVKKSDELIGSLINFIQPVLVPIMAVLLLNEQITFGLIIGGVLALVGAWLVSRRKASDK